MNEPIFEEKSMNQHVIFEGRIITVHVDDVLLPNGSTSTREVVEHPGGVCVAAITDNQELLFVQQYRYAMGKMLLELPAGKLSKGEDPLECGKRELLEETGAVGSDYYYLGESYPSPGYAAESIHLYATYIDHFEEQNLDEDEFLSVVKISLEEAVTMVLSGEISDAKTQLAILKTRALLQKGWLE